MASSILLTGGSGLLALNWARCRRDVQDVTLGLHVRNVTLARTNSLEVDLTSPEGVEAAINTMRPDLLVHTVGLTDVDRCEREPELAYQINVRLAVNVAEACARLGVSLVHISSDHLFSGDAPWADEDWPVAPVNVYGRTKAEAETGVLDACPSALVVRTNFYGWGTRYRTSFSDFIIQGLRAGRSLNLFDDVFYTPILIDSLVRATHELVDQGASGIFHVVGSERVSKYKFGLALAERFGLDTGLINLASIDGQSGLVQRPQDMSLSINKISKLLHQPIPALAEDIERLYWQEEHEVSKELAQVG